MNCQILLVNPPYLEKIYGVKRAPAVKPPLGLAYVAAGLEKAGFRVEILDANAEFLTIKEAANKIIQSPAKFIGFTSVTATFPLVCKLSSLVKSRDRQRFILVGGPHVSFMAEEALEECSAIDVVVRGEGELTACELISNLIKKGSISDVKGITFRANNLIISNQDREPIQDIDSLSFPTRHLLPLSLYSPSSLGNLGFRGERYASVITARGCPNRCVFCSSSSFWRIVRTRSPENVVSELEFLVNKYKVGQVDFLDDTLILSKERMEKICNLIIEKNLKIKWSCYARVNNITPELVKLMKKSGCKFIQFGVESGNQRILDGVQKNITLEQIRKATKIVKDAGLKLMCDFMIGLPEDTEETVNQTIKFAKELSPNFAFFSITTPFPGTILYEELLKRDWLKPGYIWQNIQLHERTDFSTPTLSSENLGKLYFKAHRRFYYRFGFFWQTLIWVLKHPSELKNYFPLIKTQIIRELRNVFK
ncbi:MAG: radical SAM protein [Nanoarchaeota archaeon]|nr:radical SAM protein [Nanoarchaeota archaeon]